MVTFLLSFIFHFQMAEASVLRAPQADPISYQSYLKAEGKKSYVEVARHHYENLAADTTPIDQCLEAIAFSPKSKNEICMKSMQALKHQLWTPPLKRVLIPFLERLIEENLQHRKLYQALLSSLREKQTPGIMDGGNDLAFREQQVFTQWLATQPEWQDAVLFVNGSELTQSNPRKAKSIVQWFVVSNAGRTLSFIGKQSDFQKQLQSSSNFQFLNCESVSPRPLEIAMLDVVEYYFSANCISQIKKPKVLATESLYSQWQKSQNVNFHNVAKLEAPSRLPKWAVPVLVGVAVGAMALKGKKVSVRMPEF